jgi:hypothetical protein
MTHERAARRGYVRRPTLVISLVLLAVTAATGVAESQSLDLVLASRRGFRGRAGD